MSEREKEYDPSEKAQEHEGTATDAAGELAGDGTMGTIETTTQPDDEEDDWKV